MSCNDPDIRYVLRTPAGAEYVSQITARESDRRTRSAFRDLVLSMAPRGARLFDFGAGPGIDARFFAERGFTIDAYDVDPRMRDYFAIHCRDLIDSGSVTLDGSAYREFLARMSAAGGRRADLVISNFAPLNLVDDLRELFAKFHALTGPNGKILASVLSPCFIGDLRSRLWWRGAPRLWRDGELFLPGPQAPYYRRLLRNFRSVSAPHFTLSRVFPGVPRSAGGHWNSAVQDGRFSWLHITRCRYVFLLFEKTVRQ
jgi:SAM-dependent methyltransferase